MSHVVRYDDALRAACRIVRSHRDKLGPRSLLLRDLYGYLALLVDRPAGSDLDPIREELHRSLGGFSPGLEGVLLGEGDLGSMDELLGDPDAMPADDGEPEVRLVERQLSGSDWWRSAAPDLADPPRLVFYGVKGGVGRSTALAVAAWHLSRQGKRVLVVDLDLESPGVSSMLLPSERAPTFGVVDWLVESAVRQGDADLLDNMLASSPLAADTSGEIWVAPAGGRDVTSFVSKLGRAYLGVTAPDGSNQPFAARLDAMVAASSSRGPRTSCCSTAGRACTRSRPRPFATWERRACCSRSATNRRSGDMTRSSTNSAACLRRPGCSASASGWCPRSLPAPGARATSRRCARALMTCSWTTSMNRSPRGDRWVQL